MAGFDEWLGEAVNIEAPMASKCFITDGVVGKCLGYLQPQSQKLGRYSMLNGCVYTALTFSNGCILLTIGSIYTKLGDFVNLGVLFQTMWINSC